MKGKRFVRILGASSLVAITITTILAMWTARAETYAHYRPEYKQIDLLPMLQKNIPSCFVRPDLPEQASTNCVQGGGRRSCFIYSRDILLTWK